MKLLIVTQVVDTEDPALGFFVRWIEEFAKHVERIEVICLKSGEFNLPANVRVHSLGKEDNPSRSWRRPLYAIRFKLFAWKLRNEYDAVLVHMNEEYVLLGGLPWRFLRKKVVFWRNHKMGSWRTRLAVWLADIVCYTSPQAFVASSAKAVRMPIGIDTELFSPQGGGSSESNSVLFIGRIDPVKRVEVFVEAVSRVSVPCRADLYGSPTESESSYSRMIAELAQSLTESKVLVLHSAVSHARTPEIYRAHAVYVNLTPSGSFDKTIGEAMASGCLVVCANDAVREVVRPDLMVQTSDPREITQALEHAIGLSVEERITETRKLRAYIEQHHSLEALIQKLDTLFR